MRKHIIQMKSKVRFFIYILFLVNVSFADDLKIATGAMNGIYYPFGKAICQILSKKTRFTSCEAKITNGTNSNLEALMNNEIDLAIIQSLPLVTDEIQALCALHAETLSILVREDSNIYHLKDIKGKKINIGQPGSGIRDWVKVLKKTFGWKMKNFEAVEELGAIEQGEALCKGKIDVMIQVMGHPNHLMQELTSRCEVRILSLTASEINKLIAYNSYYTPINIKGKIYSGNTEDIKTVGIRALLVAKKTYDDKSAFIIVKALAENMAILQKLHPALSNFTPSIMRDQSCIPFHLGALQYYNSK